MSNRFEARYVPPPQPAPGKIVVQPPQDANGRAICPVLHLLPEMAEQLLATLQEALDDYRSRPE